ncbi:MAG: carbamate kinase [Clostridiaceae bacterium]|nr:carbamate kinase [Clostridiaceae bacterium]
MKKRIVVALGGNALGNTAQEQRELVRQTAVPIVDLIVEGHEVVIAHGNGPQVGMINLAFDCGDVPPMPFPECGAMSQGYIGYHLQNAIREELLVRGLNKPVVTIITQVVVDKEDPAFQNPTKPIGSFYSQEQAEKIAEQTGFTMREDAGRGYRRVVASPRPTAVVEDRTVKALIREGQVVITVGGGGIPVIREGDHLEGVAAVIDKDFASEVLAAMIDADYLIILTAVEKIALNYGKPNETWLDKVTVAEMEQYMEEGHFAPGSMLPKVEASVAFAKSGPGRTALVTSLENARDGIAGKTGTHISM